MYFVLVFILFTILMISGMALIHNDKKYGYVFVLLALILFLTYDGIL